MMLISIDHYSLLIYNQCVRIMSYTVTITIFFNFATLPSYGGVLVPHVKKRKIGDKISPT